MASVIVGIDVGGTKTKIQMWSPDGNVEEHEYSTAKWRKPGWRQHPALLVDMMKRSLKGHEPAAIVMGANGCDSSAECQAFEQALGGHFDVPLRVLNDAELLPLSVGVDDAIAVIAGTGAIAVTRDGDGVLMSAGGWGWVIGDDGSASGLVRAAATQVTRHLDRGGDASERLVSRMFEALDVRDQPRFGSSLAELRSSAEVGKLAPSLFAAYREGSELAIRTVTEGAAALVELVECLVERGATATQVVLGGGVAANEPILVDHFQDQFSRTFGIALTMQVFHGDPVIGACQLASRLAGWSQTPLMKENC